MKIPEPEEGRTAEVRALFLLSCKLSPLAKTPPLCRHVSAF